MSLIIIVSLLCMSNFSSNLFRLRISSINSCISNHFFLFTLKSITFVLLYLLGILLLLFISIISVFAIKNSFICSIISPSLTIICVYRHFALLNRFQGLFHIPSQPHINTQKVCILSLLHLPVIFILPMLQLFCYFEIIHALHPHISLYSGMNCLIDQAT